LATSYAITNRNVSTTQDTQERNQAQQIVQQQIERLRALASSDKLASEFKPGGCIIGSGGALQGSTGAADACKFAISGGTCSGDPCFEVTIEKDATTGIYEITSQWDSLKGQKSSVVMEYGV
jgi:hypothetical protein